MSLSIDDAEPGVNCGHADGLSKMAFANATIAQHEDVLVLFNESSPR